MYCSFKGAFNKVSINTYMKIWHTRDRFSTFLKLTCKLQSTRSPKLSDGFWCFLVQNEAGVLLISLLCSVSYFCLVEKRQKLQEKFRTLFSRHLPSLPQQASTGKVGDAPWPNDENLTYKYRILVLDRSLIFERTTKRQRSPCMNPNGAIQNVYHGVKFKTYVIPHLPSTSLNEC